MSEKLGLNPWLSMWIAPRKTLQRIVATDPGHRFIWLSGIYGFPALMQIAQTFSLALYFSWPVIVSAAVFLGIFIGMLGISVTSALIYWVGKWIGGVGSFVAIRAAVAWANVPNIVTCLTWIVWITIFQERLFYQGVLLTPFPAQVQAAVTGLALVQLVVGVWSLVLLFKGLSEVQGFSVWKAILNVFLPFALIVIASWAVMWVIWWIRGFI